MILRIAEAYTPDVTHVVSAGVETELLKKVRKITCSY